MQFESPLFTIDPDRPFADDLAAGLLARAGGDPMAMADLEILLPTRRACRALREAFLRVADGRAMILPAMRPLGDVDEDEILMAGPVASDGDMDLPPAISGMERALVLAQMIEARRPADAPSAGPEQAVRLGTELGRFLDQVQTEGLSLDRLDGLVEADYAAHWQETLDFLHILRSVWPEYLKNTGALDPSDRRNRLMAKLIAQWKENPPLHPIIAAGTTGSIPATASLLETVAALPKGAVVLPGLDRYLDEEGWQAVLDDPTHPQHGLALLLQRLDRSRETVLLWRPDGTARNFHTKVSARSALISETLRPAADTHRWRHIDPAPGDATDGFSLIECANATAEAQTIALMLRSALEEPEQTAALVTPDRVLARRVAAELRRWKIEIDDSAGEPLSASLPGSFARLVLDAASNGFAPVEMLALLKHPLTAGGMAPGRFRTQARRLERLVLRGPRPAPGFAGLRADLEVALADDRKRTPENAALKDFLDDIERRLEPVAALMPDGDRLKQGEHSISILLKALLEACEALAESDTESGANRLWAGEAGEAFALFIAELDEAGRQFNDMWLSELRPVLEALMVGRVVRPGYGRHPRLFIWGPLEARLQRADLMILGGLNEGTWPGEPDPDPWMSRPMRRDFGLPAPERRIGLSAHDFAQAAHAPSVVMTRALKVDGQPTVPSRWLTRLEAVMQKAEVKYRPYLGTDWRALQHALDMTDADIRISPPEPRPPLAARPRRLSVTRIETWMRDPYSIFARFILNLEKLDPIAADPGAAERGNFIHDALDGFVKAYPDALPEDALDRLLELGQKAFGPALHQPAVKAFWWPRFERIAEWFVGVERDRRQSIEETQTEISGEMLLSGPGGPFTLTAKADRIDRRHDGSFAIIDYKTGSPPSDREVKAGLAPQLPLEAAMVEAGAYAKLGKGVVGELAFWRLTGMDPAGKEQKVKADPSELAAEAREGLEKLIATFDDEATPYRAKPRPKYAPRYNDYEHLARVREWSASDSEEGGEE